MLRKVVWSLLYATFGAVATIAARVISVRLWRLTTGQEPPAT